MVISRHISGKFRTFRYLVQTVLFGIYFIVPWVRIYGGLPLMRLDIPTRKTYLLGAIYIPQEGIFLHLFLIIMGLSLFFFTSLIGRVWCGWACPQTVFTDLFDIFGRLILGKKYGKKDAPVFGRALLQITWVLVALFSAFHFVAYFSDPYEMLKDIPLLFHRISELSWPYFTAFFAALLYLDMTFVREQFCKFACPYARFQTVMLDGHSLNITYDYKRGEPRRNKKEKIGDCTACNMCLVVCPTGIDIRDGLQVGCIACAKCVDACTIQMGKENKRSLIGYNTQELIENGAKIKWVRPRTIIYAVILTLVSISAVNLLIKRIPFYLSILPDRNVLPMDVGDGTVRNFFNLSIHNLTFDDKNFKIQLDESSTLFPAKLLIGEENGFVTVPKNSQREIRVIVDAAIPAEYKHSKVFLNLNVRDEKRPDQIRTKSISISTPGN